MAPKSMRRKSPARRGRSAALACGSADRSPDATIVSNGNPLLPSSRSARSSAPAISSSVCPVRTVESVRSSARSATRAAAVMFAISPSSFCSRSVSTTSVVARHCQCEPALSNRSKSRCTMCADSNPTTSTPAMSAIWRQTPFHRLCGSIATRARSPTSSLTCVAYRKSVTNTSSRSDATRIALDPENPVRYRMLGRLVTSKASRCAARNAAASAATRSDRRSLTRQGGDDASERELVAARAETAHHGERARGEHRMAPLRLAREDVAQVHFDERYLHRGKRVANGEAAVAVRAGVDQSAIGAAAQRLDHIHQLPFSVPLGELQFHVQLARDAAQVLFDVGQRVASVQLRLPNAEEIEIGAVQNGDAHYF